MRRRLVGVVRRCAVVGEDLLPLGDAKFGRRHQQA
ncbi:hypothetical protein B1M_11845, partial [Burkholderia sp. TJI49]